MDGVKVSFSGADRTALQRGRMLRATVEKGKGKWEYFGLHTRWESGGNCGSEPGRGREARGKEGKAVLVLQSHENVTLR